MACLGTRSHRPISSCDFLNGGAEYGLELLQAIRDGTFSLSGDKKTAMDRLLEARLPIWVRLRSSDDAWIGNATLRKRGRRIRKLACGENRILKIVHNTELE
jgi:hypothetical protein